jgi:hypothetical protein
MISYVVLKVQDVPTIKNTHGLMVERAASTNNGRASPEVTDLAEGVVIVVSNFVLDCDWAEVYEQVLVDLVAEFGHNGE